MKKPFALVSLAALALIFAAVSPARAGQEGAPIPVVDTFEDGDQRLKLVALQAPEGDRLDVTLVYEDRETQTLRSVTVDPAAVGTPEGAAFAEFLEEMDPGFLSYVRAALADRMLHLKGAPNHFERAVSRMFFQRGAGRGAVAVTTAEVNLAE